MSYQRLDAADENPTPYLATSAPPTKDEFLPAPFPEWRPKTDSSPPEYLPAWATFRKVRQMANEETNGEKTVPRMNQVTGPAILYQWGAMFAMLYFLTLIPLVQFYVASCEQDVPGPFGAHEVRQWNSTTLDKQRMAFAPSPDLLLWSAFFIPGAVTLLVVQHICLRFVLPSMLDEIRYFDPEADMEFLFFKVAKWKIPFWAWYGAQCVMLMFNLLDNMTNAMFTARLVATFKLGGICTSYNKVQDMWYKNWSASLFGTIVKGLGSETFSFESIVGYYYIFQLLFQPLAALFFTMPYYWWPHYWPVFNNCCSCCRRKVAKESRRPDWAFIDGKTLVAIHEAGDEVRESPSSPDPIAYRLSTASRTPTRTATPVEESYQRRVRELATYTTLADHKDDTTYYKSAFVILAEATRMELFVSQDLIHREAHCKWLSKEFGKLEGKSLSDPDEAVSSDRQKHIYLDQLLDLVHTGVIRGVMRFGLRGFIQNAVQVNFQTSMVAIGRGMNVPGADDPFNNLTTALTVLGMFFDIPDMLALICFVRKQSSFIDEHTTGPKYTAKKKHFNWWRRCLYIVAVIYFIFAALSFEKVALAYWCPCGVSNLAGCTIEADTWARVYHSEKKNCDAAISNLSGR